jgi:amino acid/peptide:H+ symporter
MSFGLSFYGVMSILTRFFLEELKYSEADTMMVVGSFSAIGPLFAIAGGFISDKFLGPYRTLTLGYISFTTGYFLLILGASTTNIPLSLMGIALASYARGMKSPSYPTLFKKTFTSTEDFENAYPVNYSVNNLGALLGQYLFPLLILTISFYGGFLISTLLASIAVAILILKGKSFKKVSVEKDQKPVGIKNWSLYSCISLAMIGLVFFMFSNIDIGKNIVYAIGLGSIIYFISLMFKASKAERLNMGAILIIFFLTTAFFVYYGQMMTSMTMVSINTMRGDLFGFIPIAPEASMSMNPLWCMVAGPVLTWIFSSLEDRNIHFSTATKVSFAFVLTAIAFGILTVAVKNIGKDVTLSPEIFLVIHFFQGFAEVIVGSLVVAFILSVAPKYIESFSVSLFSVAIALSGIVGAVFSTSIAIKKGQEITQELVKEIYGGYFEALTLWAIVLVIVALIGSYAIKKLITKSAKLIDM